MLQGFFSYFRGNLFLCCVVCIVYFGVTGLIILDHNINQEIEQKAVICQAIATRQDYASQHIEALSRVLGKEKSIAILRLSEDVPKQENYQDADMDTYLMANQKMNSLFDVDDTKLEQADIADIQIVLELQKQGKEIQQHLDVL